MKALKTILIIGMVLGSLIINAQTDTVPKAKKDTTRFNLGKTEVIIIENRDSSGKNDNANLKSFIDSIAASTAAADTSNKAKKSVRRKKPAHVWAGIDLGINTLLNADRSFSLTGADAPYSLNYAKSIAVGINLFEQTIPIVKNNVYLSTGIGLEFNNFRFDNVGIKLNPDTVPLVATVDTSRNYTKNKLVTSYLNVPLLLTFAANNKKGKNAFHISVGAMVGWKYRSHQKMVYNEDGDKKKYKEFDNFNTNPFRFTAMARLGYKKIGVFANYALNPLFQKNKGPNLSPFTMGFSLIF